MRADAVPSEGEYAVNPGIILLVSNVIYCSQDGLKQRLAVGDVAV